jgi:hypothetical protein
MIVRSNSAINRKKSGTSSNIARSVNENKYFIGIKNDAQNEYYKPILSKNKVLSMPNEHLTHGFR